MKWYLALVVISTMTSLAAAGEKEAFDPGGLTMMKVIEPYAKRYLKPTDVEAAVWPTAMIDAGRTHYLNQSTPTIMIFALANPRARKVTQLWLCFDLPEGVALRACNAYLDYRTAKPTPIQRGGKAYQRYAVHLYSGPTTFPQGMGSGGWFQRSRPPALWLETTMPPGSRPGRVYYHLRYELKDSKTPVEGNEGWVHIGVLPKIAAAQPRQVSSGVMGRFIFNYSSWPADMKLMLTKYVQQLGYTYYVDGPPLDRKATPALRRWLTSPIQNGFRIGTPDQIPDNIKWVGKKEHPNAVAPWAIIERDPWVVKHLFDTIDQAFKEGLGHGNCLGIWANWEPYGYLVDGDYSTKSRDEFIKWSKLPADEVKRGWPDQTVNIYAKQWQAFQNWELGEVVKAVSTEVKKAGQAVGVPDAKFALATTNDAIWSRIDELPLADPSALSWGDLPYVLQTWQYYNIANAESGPVTDCRGAAQVQRTGALAHWINEKFGPKHQVILGCLWGWDQTGGRGFMMPEEVGFLQLSGILAGMKNIQNYAEWPIFDGRYAQRMALANTRIARWEKYVVDGTRQRTHVVIPVSPYPQQVADTVNPADQVVSDGWNRDKPQYLYSFEYQLNGKRLFAVANSWDDGECFVRLRVPGLPTDARYVLTEPEANCVFADEGGKTSLSSDDLDKGIVVHIGAMRWGAFLLQNAQGKVPLTVITPKQTLRIMAQRQRALETALKDDRFIKKAR
jgi:hypothetical protein